MREKIQIGLAVVFIFAACLFTAWFTFTSIDKVASGTINEAIDVMDRR